MSGRGAKARELRGHKKLDYKSWIRFRDLMDELRDQFSLTQISDLFRKDPGWAQKAYDFRGLVFGPELKRAEELVDLLHARQQKPTTNKTQETPVVVKTETPKPKFTPIVGARGTFPRRIGPDLTEAQRNEVLQIIAGLVGYFGTATKVCEALNLHRSTISEIRSKKGATSSETYNKIKNLWDEVKHADAPAPASTPREAEMPETPYVAEQSTTLFAPEERSINLKKDEPKKVEQPFAWMGEVQLLLMQASELITHASKTVPEKFRAPYREQIEKLEALAAEYEA